MLLSSRPISHTTISPSYAPLTIVAGARNATAITSSRCSVEAHAAASHVQVGLIVFPRVRWPRARFVEAVARLRERHADAHGGTPPMALAAFHPAPEPVEPAAAEEPARLVPFIRRSPDPTIQCVRLSVLEEVRRPSDRGTGFVDLSTVDLAAFLATPPKKPLHERVAARNRDTLRELGLAEAERVLAAIEADRRRSYAALGLSDEGEAPSSESAKRR